MNIAVFGAKGRVGSRVCELAKKRGHNVWEIDKNHSKNELEKVDAAINFATADATVDVVNFCREKNCPLVSGTTGLNESERDLIQSLACDVTVIEKANFSLGVNMLYKLCDIISRELNWDCVIVETHRREKKDSPSGTAKEIAATIAKNKGSFSCVEVHSLRLGSNFGEHDVTFATNGERLTITHKAENVDAFALGAIQETEALGEFGCFCARPHIK